MYQTRATISKKIPIPRKGTKYVVRALSHVKDSVPVVIAVRDMLKLARTSKEVNEMIKNKSLKLNGKEITDRKESIRLFNIFEAGKTYTLTLSNKGKFLFEETKSTKERLCKIIDKKILKGKKVQLNLHDGSNVLTTEKVSVQDSVYLDFSGKITNTIKFEKGKDCVVTSGKYAGFTGKVQSVENGKVKVVLADKAEPAELEKRSITVR